MDYHVVDVFRLLGVQTVFVEVCPLPQKMKDLYEDSLDAKQPEHVTNVIIHEATGTPGCKALSDSLNHIKYKHVKQMKLWKAYIYDEGV